MEVPSSVSSASTTSAATTVTTGSVHPLAPIFRDVKFYLSGDVPPQVTELLCAGGGKPSAYFSDAVSHLICGADASETDLIDASDVYEIPAATYQWVYACVRANRLLTCKPYNPSKSQLFSNVVLCISRVSPKDAKYIYALVTYHGGRARLDLDHESTHLVVGSPTGAKYAAALANPKCSIVTPDWVTDSVRAKSLCSCDIYHPRLLKSPPPPTLPSVVQPSNETRSNVATFDFEEGIAKSEVPTQTKSDIKDIERTQALVDKLKQRMPWTSSSTLSNPNSISNTAPKLMMHPNMLNQNSKTISNISAGNPTSQQHNSVMQNNSTANQHVSSPNIYVDATSMQMLGKRMPLQVQRNQQQRLQQQHSMNMTQMNHAVGIQQQNQNLPTSHPSTINILNQGGNVTTSVSQLLQQSHNNHQQIVTSGMNQQNAVPNKQVPNSIMNQQLQQGLIGHQSQANTMNQQVNPGIGIGQHTNQIQNQQNLMPVNQHQVQQNQNAQQNLPMNQQVHNLNQSNQNISLNPQQNLNIGINQQNINAPMNQQNIQNVQQTNSNPTLSQQPNQIHALAQQQQQQQHNQPNLSIQNPNIPTQVSWRQQQNIQMIPGSTQSAIPNQQIIRGGLMQQRGQLQQNQMIVQQQIVHNPNIVNQQSQIQNPAQHNIISQQNQQLIAQGNGRQLQTISQPGQQQLLVQKQTGQQILNIGQQANSNQQIVLNQSQANNSAHQQIIVQGNQHITLPNNQQIAQGSTQILSQNGQQIITQGQQIISQTGQQILNASGQQIITQGNQQILTQSGQQIVAQGQVISQGSQLLTQSGQQIAAQGHQIIAQGQQINTQGQQIINQTPQMIQQGQPPQQVITHQTGQQVITQSGQQIVTQQAGQQQLVNQQGGQQMITWQQQQFLQQRQQQIIAGQPAPVGQRMTWSVSAGGRQLIHLDAQTHAQLQQMDPQQRAQYVNQLQKRHQLSAQRAAQQQQAGHPTQHTLTLVRGQIPPGLTPQQQVQWVQQQGVRAASIGTGDAQVIARQQPQPPQQQPQQPQQPQQLPQSHQHSQQPQQQQLPHQQQQQQQQFAQLQLQRQPQYQRLRLQTQIRDPNQKIQGGSVQVGVPQGAIAARQIIGPALPDGASQQPDGTIIQQGAAADQVGAVIQGSGAPPLVVNPRTKTALANMLSIRLQSTQPNALPQDVSEPSAAGTLRLMTAAHNAPPRAPTEVVQTLQQRRTLTATPGPMTHHQLPISPHTHQQLVKPAYGMNAPGGVVPGRAPTPAPPSAAALTRAQFYGHNPNLKLPPDLFLLGCVFHVVEYGNDPSHNIKQWTEAVSRHGGEVELGYCARVTHVLAQTQKHGVVMQALRDSKRCVTAYWLSDTMIRRQVAPPWQALHLPLMYAQHEKPAQRHRASLSGFIGEERERVKFMLEHTGAKTTTYMSRDNTVLICRRPEGPKYQKAREWGIPVVSVQWLTDILLGNMSALTQLEHNKYQQFSVGNPFRMDYALVPHLMNAWKMPINISQESHERVKRGTLSAMNTPKAKKPRLSQSNPSPSQVITCVERPDPAYAPRVMFSSLKDIEPYSNIVKQLGGFIANQASEATHLVMGRLVRTPKFITALITVKYILSIGWLTESQKIGKFAEESKFPLRDESFDEMFRCDISKMLSVPPCERSKLFDGITFYMTPGVQPGRSVLTEMIELCSGKVDKNRKSYMSIQEIHKQKPYSYIVLTAMNDLHLVYYLLQAEKNLNIVCNTELVLTAIMQQRIDVQEHLVKID